MLEVHSDKKDLLLDNVLEHKRGHNCNRHSGSAVDHDFKNVLVLPEVQARDFTIRRVAEYTNWRTTTRHRK